MRAFTQHCSEEFIHIFASVHVHTRGSDPQTEKQRFRYLNLGMNSHRRRTLGFHEILIYSGPDVVDQQTAA